MKATIGMKLLSFGVAVTMTLISAATLAKSDFESLGANEGILQRARALNTKQQIRIVQKRAVDRDMRLELGFAYGGVAGGNSYLNSQPLMGTADFHFTPRVSIGFRYSQYANQLSREGQSQFELARAAQQAGQLDYTIPQIDIPKSSMMGMLSYYPLYGKLNFFDLSVVQFDIYLTGGYGQMELKSGSSPTWTAGGGVGFWWTQNFSSRLEIRHQGYQDKVYIGTRDVGMMIGTIGIGLLL
jgi:outer membrane beta-barrel protein